MEKGTYLSPQCRVYGLAAESGICGLSANFNGFGNEHDIGGSYGGNGGFNGFGDETDM